MLRTAASLAGLTAVFVLVLYLAYGSGDGGDPTATPVPSEAVAAPTRTGDPTLTPPPQPSPTPSYLLGDLQGTSVIPLRQGDPIDFPPGVALIIETGCWQCDGPTTGLDRVYRDASGKIRRETLVSADMLGLADNQGTPPVILGFDALDDASWIVVAFCTAGDCGWLGIPDATARTTFVESADGGVTWSQVAELEGAYRIVSIVPVDFYAQPDVLVSGPVSVDPEVPDQHRYWKLVSGQPVVPPTQAGTDAYPRVAPSGEIMWQTGDYRIVTSSGDTFFYAGSATYPTGDIVTDLGGTRWGLPWSLPTGGVPAPQFLTLTDEGGRTIRTLEYPRYISWGVNSKRDVMYGNAAHDGQLLDGELPLDFPASLPVEIRLNEATFHPILGPFDDVRNRLGRNRVVAVQAGPFARVVNTDGLCVNVRAPAGLDSMIFDCVAEGVLLHDTHEHAAADGLDWTRIITPSGLEGWVASEYLESDTVVTIRN